MIDSYGGHRSKWAKNGVEVSNSGFMALILYRVMRQRLKAAGHDASPESALAQLRKIQRQSVAINQGVPVSGISNIHREQADLLAAMNIRKPVPDAQLSLL